MNQIIYKVPHGKLLKIKFEVRNNVIESFELRGDFFMHPEGALQELESFVLGAKLDEEFVPAVDRFLSQNAVEVFGFGAKDLFDALTQSV